MAHPVRRAQALRIQKQLGGATVAPITFDTHKTTSNDPKRRWTTGRRAWEKHDPKADWHVVFQDDITPATNLIKALPTVLATLPPRTVVSLYATRPKPDTPRRRRDDRAIARAQQNNTPWINHPRIVWGPAIAVPTHTITDMLEWCTHRVQNETTTRRHYDTMIGDYYWALQYRAWHTLPNLVEHDDNGESLVGHGKTHPRKATLYTGEDPTPLPWHNHPPR